jgi:hypothetical protein
VFSRKGLINEARDTAEKLRYSNPKAVVTPAPEPLPLPEPAALTIGSLFEQLVEAITNRVIEKLQAAAPEASAEEKAGSRLDELFDNPIAQLNKLTIRKQPVKKRPTVLIIGLNGFQMDIIKHYMPDLDYTFATAEQAVSHHTLNKDHTILMTKFINHSVQAKNRKHPNLH